MALGDIAMRNHGNSTPMPQFDTTPWVTPVPLRDA